MPKPVVEILYFEDCPNHEGTRAIVDRVAAELGLEPTIELVNVPDGAAAARLRFLGSPTVRVDGHDVEPGAERRTEFALSCGVYRTAQGFVGQPESDWVRRRPREGSVDNLTTRLIRGRLERSLGQVGAARSDRLGRCPA